MKLFSKLHHTHHIHPIVKRIVVATLIVGAIALFRAYYGVHSSLIGLLTGVGAFIFADWMFSTPEERQARTRHVTEFFREYFMLVMCAYFIGSLSEPADPTVKLLLALVQSFGLVAIFIVPIIVITMKIAIVGTLPSIVGLGSRLLSGLAFYSLALWLIGHSGDDIYKWVLARPKESAIVTISFVITWVIVQFSTWSPQGNQSIGLGMKYETGAVASVNERKPTVRDNQYTAAHEAGHALVYAALGGLPPDVMLAINDHPDNKGVLGFLTDIGHLLSNKAFAEWYMLVFLAGKMGESAMLGETTLGSSNDHARWLNLARRYLANHYKGIYYVEPLNDFEQKQNEAKLVALQADQLLLLSRLLDLNAEILKELTASLLAKRTLTRDELIPFLRRVQFPPEFPFPFGLFDQFSNDWPEQRHSLINDT